MNAFLWFRKIAVGLVVGTYLTNWHKVVEWGYNAGMADFTAHTAALVAFGLGVLLALEDNDGRATRGAAKRRSFAAA